MFFILYKYLQQFTFLVRILIEKYYFFSETES